MKITLSSKATLTKASSEVIQKIIKELTMPNPAYLEAKKHDRWTGNLEPELKFYELKPGSISFPRGYARRAWTLSAEQGQNPALEDHRRILEPLDLDFKGKLREYQQKALNDILSRDDGVLEASTGSGKTVMALAVIAVRKQPTLILVHTKELLQQWQERIKSFMGIDPGQIGAGKKNIQPVTVGMVQTVKKHLESLPEHFGHLIIDECHRAPSTTFSECVAAFDCRFLLGLSATPFRRDGLGKLIYWTLGEQVHKIDPQTLKANGSVLDFSILMPHTEFKYHYKDDYQTMIKALTEDEERNRLIVDRILSAAFNLGGTCLVVSDRLEHLNTLSTMLEQQGAPNTILTGSTPQKERESSVEDVQAGKIKILLSTVSLIGEGFDCPCLDTLFLTTPIKYKGRLIQVIGRILRPAPGKDPYLYDFWDREQPILNKQALHREKIYNEEM